MPFGSLLTNQTAPFIERHFYATWNTQISSGQNWTPAVTSMTMPFAGEILVDLYVQCSYQPSILGIEVWPATPIGASNYWRGQVTEYNVNGGLFVCPMFGRWANLAAGTFFDLTIEIRNKASNGICTIQQVDGLMRAVAY